jgi:hypothetical protein
MIYGALDYYHCQMEIPSDTKAPARGTPLHDYIYRRQCDAHLSSGAKFGGLWVPLVGGALEALGLDVPTEHAKACSYLSRGLPVPVCLVGGFLSGHHVLAIGTGAAATYALEVYDPNAPDRAATIHRRGDGKIGNTCCNNVYGTYFVDDGYTRCPPNLVYGQENWRWCWKCQGLYFAGAGRGVCPAGGGHDQTGSDNYVLADGAGSGQKSWRWCCKCQGLYFGFNGRAGACPAGNRHDGSRSGDYVLAIDGVVGQQNWRWCSVCDGLYFAGNGTMGVCPKNARGHDGSMSGNYVVPAVSGS